MSENLDEGVLTVECFVPAAPERVFAAWTEPEQIVQWWGPEGVDCPHAEMEVRVGGAYRIANALPDGLVVWIVGVFDVVRPPSQLGYSWHMEVAGERTTDDSYVTVTFNDVDGGTNVIVTHERIASDEVRREHENGWRGCLAGLVEMLQRR